MGFFGGSTALRRGAVGSLAVAALAGGPTAATADAAERKPRLTVTVTSKPAVVAPGASATLGGQARGPLKRRGRYSVVLQERMGTGWIAQGRGRVGARRAFRIRWTAPRRLGARTMRVRLLHRGRPVATSRAWRMSVIERGTPPRPPAPVPPAGPQPAAPELLLDPPRTPAPDPPQTPAPDPPQTLVVAPSIVETAPGAGTIGVLRLTGAVAVEAGDVLASGIGDAAPYGFLFRATGVRGEGGDTLVDVRPATLREAIPEASIHESFEFDGARRRSLRDFRRRVTCSAGGDVTIEGTADLGSPQFQFDADWGIFSLNSLRATASVTASASATASATGSASCTVGPIKLLERKLTPITFFVAGIPVVLVPEIEIELSGLGEVEAEVATGVSATLTATAGAEYEDGELSPIADLTETFSHQPPDPEAAASLAATLTSSLEIAAYGVGGPEFAFNAGLELDADPEADPWWTLDAPISFTAGLDVDILDVEVGPITVYEDRFRIAQAAPGPGPEPGSRAATGLDVGFGHACGLRKSGRVRCWGTNPDGQLGNGSEAPSSTPVAVIGIRDATQISAGSGRTCALRGAGTISCWGRNQFGALGNGTEESSSTPVAVSGIGDAAQVSTGSSHSCAVRVGGTVSCWGSNDYGRLGNGSDEHSSTPVGVTGISNAVKVAASQASTCALHTGGGVSCWGRNDVGELGDGTNANSNVPVAVTGIGDATQVSTSGPHACALRAGGTISCWGFNRFGQLGDGTTDDAPSPVAVAGISDATYVSAGVFHTCAVRAGGTVSCWGYNEDGELGNGTKGGHSTSPVAVTGIADASQVEAGNTTACALRAGGAISCWGSNYAGELGDGTTTHSSTPVPVTGFP